MFRTLYILSSIALICNAAPSQPPLQVRANSDLWKNVFHRRDQLILDVVKYLKLDSENGSNDFKDVFASIVPKNGLDAAIFDFDLHVQADYLGVETDKLAFEGKGKYKGVDFTFSGPLSLLKLQYKLGEKTNGKMNYSPLVSKVFEQEAWNFDASPASLIVTGASLPDEAKTQLLGLLKDKVSAIKDKCLAGQEEDFKEFPIDLVAPFDILSYAIQFAETANFDGGFVELGFSLRHIETLSQEKNEGLKEIEGGFYNEKNNKGENAFAQVLLDDNAFNAWFLAFVENDKVYGLRDMGTRNPKMKRYHKEFNKYLMIPEGSDTSFSFSHKLFKNGFPKSKMSGFQMDKNGNWKVTLNVAATIDAEEKKNSNVWTKIRDIYITLDARFKITQNEENPDDKQFTFLLKSLEITKIKSMQGSKDMSQEMDIIKWKANEQFKSMVQDYEPVVFDTSDIIGLAPQELQCFGYEISDLDMSFKKSQMQLSAYYKTVENPDKKFCDAFGIELMKPEQKLADIIMNNPKTAQAKYLQKLRKELEQQYSNEGTKPDDYELLQGRKTEL